MSTPTDGPTGPAPLFRYYQIDEQVFAVTLHEPAGRRPVPEALLQDLWRQQRFDLSSMETTDGRPLTVLDPGRLNTDGGPDFRHAHLLLDGTGWHGDVEIHPTSSGWVDHEHHTDERYNSVVLHVVLRSDEQTNSLRRADGTVLPELVLTPLLDTPLRTLLHTFRTRPEDQIPCAARWKQVPDAVRKPWIEHLAYERFERKKERLADRYLARPDLETLLHERLFAGLGYAKNDAPMSDLARRLPLPLTRRADTLRDLEALHLGTAGLLPSPADLLDADRATADYATDLAERFDQLRSTHALRPMERPRWQFFRLRPANFPPLRIAQAVAWLAPGGLLRHDPVGKLRQALRSDAPVATLRKALAARPSDFWKTHVRLEKPSKPRDPSLGQSRIDTLIINAVLPVLLLHADHESDPALSETVFEVLQRLPAPRDRITRRFRKLGTRPQSAFEAQGLHQLYRTRCTEARCLECSIGQHLLNREGLNREDE